VESEAGKGSTFHFTASFGLAKSQMAKAAVPGAVELRDLRVLVVDDNATNRRILEEMLTGWNMRPMLAEGGREALVALRLAKGASAPFPLVLTDMQMPEMDGFALAARIKEDPLLAGATIMMLTSAGQRGDAARCRELGIAAYLTKPIKQSDLLGAISTALGKRSQKADRSVLVTRHSLREARRVLRILVAEDNVVNLTLAIRLLEKRGHTVVAANNGREAVAILEKSAFTGFDVVLMDVQMPEMDGFEATAAIREKEKAIGHRLPIIALTAHSMKGDRERCLAAGMDGYVSKPINVEELMEVIQGFGSAQSDARPGVPLPSSPSEVSNGDLALNRLEGDRELLRELLDIFARDCPRMVAEIKKALGQGSPKALQAAAHSLRGALSNFGESPAWQAASKLEEMGLADTLNGAKELFAQLEEGLAAFKPALVIPGEERNILRS